MAIYSIKDLEQLTGIKAHTIRIWEQRYEIIVPERTQTNIRYYEDKDLKKLLNVALLNKNGFKISKIALMNDEEILAKVSCISSENFEHSTQLDALTISMIEMDEVKFDKIISSNIKELGFERTMMEVIYPFLDKLGVLWLTGSINPVQENFMGYLIRQKIIVAIDELPLNNKKDAKKFLLYLPEGESQELSLLFMHYLLKSRGFSVLYIGQNISVEDLKDVYSIHKPDYIYTIITETFIKQGVQTYIDALAKYFADVQFLFSGYQVIAQSVKPPKNVSILKNLEHTLHFLDAK